MISLTVSNTIIVATVIISLYHWSLSEDRQHRWMLHPYSIKHKRQFDRFLSSGVIHSGYVHLLFNMLTFYFFGGYVESAFTFYLGGAVTGSIAFVALYLLGMVVSAIPSVYKHRDQPHYYSLGASGAVSAVVFSAIMFNPVMPICLFFAICLPGFILGTLYLIYSYFQGRAMADHINHDAHLYGALFGMVFTLILKPSLAGSFVDALANWEFTLFSFF